MHFDIITTFPNFFDSFKKEALISRAQNKKLISISTHNLRNFADDKRGTVDDRPYGGGAGMVLKVDPIYRSVSTLKSKVKSQKSKVRTVLLSAKGKTFTQKDARRLVKYNQLIFICGRYEGVDERVAKYVADEEMSIGNYVLFGGEVPAMVVIEAVSRLISGVVQKEESIKNESFSDKEAKIKEHPQYTRPEVFKFKTPSSKGRGSSDKVGRQNFLASPSACRGRAKFKILKVPRVLLSGDHKKIKEWRQSHNVLK